MEAELVNSAIYYGKILLESSLPVLTLCTGNKAISTYTLHRDYNPKDVSRVSVPKELKQKYTDIEIKQITSKRIKDKVLEFASVIKKEFPESAQMNFYNNVNEVNIKWNLGIALLAAEGLYTSEKNKINYITITSIYHELFHMASTYHDKEENITYSGFSQTYHDKGKLKTKSIGSGITEGYTELLAHRYFDKNNKTRTTYNYEIGIVKALEKIIGPDNMQGLYLKADLNGLIEELKKYAQEDDIIHFIRRVDLVSGHSDDIFLFKNNKMKESINDTYKFLLHTYVKKMEVQLENGNITQDEFVEKTARYIKDLGTKIRIGGHKYEYLQEEVEVKPKRHI